MVTAERLGDILAQGIASGTMTLEEAEAVCAEYPYFQAAQLVKASMAIKNAGKADAAANAVLVADRSILYSAVYGEPSGYDDFTEGQPDEVFLQQEPAETLVATTQEQQYDTGSAEGYGDAEEPQAYGEDAPGEMHTREMPTEGVDATGAAETVVGVEEMPAGVATQGLDVDESCAECIDTSNETIKVRREAAAEGAEIEDAQGPELKDVQTADGHEELAPSVAGEGVEDKVGAALRVAVAEEEGGEEERASEAQSESSDEVPTIDLQGVLEQALSREVPDMAPSISPFGTVGFSLTQQDIDYINAHLNPRNARVSSADADSSGAERLPSQAQRIDSFIENFDNILSKVLEEERTGEARGEEPDDLAESQSRLDSHIASERLAFLLAEKGEYDVAIQMYERLGAQNPEKSSYFAEIIARLNARKGKK